MKRSKRIVGMILGILIAIGPLSAAHAARLAIADGTYAYLRSGPGTEYAIIESVLSGALLHITERGDTWSQVTVAENGTTGYLRTATLRLHAHTDDRLTPLPGYQIDFPRMTTDLPLGIPPHAPVEDAFFDDAAFVGDSITLALQNYVLRIRRTQNPNFMGKAIFLAAGCFSSRFALMDVSPTTIHPIYKGYVMKVEDAIAFSQSKKVYIMLGMNDLAGSGVEQSLRNMETLCQRIMAKNPDVTIYIEANTPQVEGRYALLYTDEIFDYNVGLYEMCQRNGYQFVDIGYALRNEKGWLPAEYCADLATQRIHPNDAACALWIDYLKTHALPQ